MQYRVLVNGSNLAIVKDFLNYRANYFDCLSTTDSPTDLEKHFKLFMPHALICFVDRIYDGLMENMIEIKNSPEYNSAPIIFITKEEVSQELEANFDKSVVDLILLRPITTDNIILQIMNYLDAEVIKRSMTLEGEKISVEDMPAPPPPVPEKPAEPDRKKHVLVVDDDRNVLKMLKTALEEKYEVTATLNGLLVEKILSSKPVDLIVLDYEMPIMTGAEVYRKIKDNAEYSTIPICFLTGVSDRNKVMEIMSLRPDSYLLKPIDLEMLLTAIENLT
ncbi:MAG: response regulator [Oscillospiraceae bacterium]|nr:response regulator [Oscillospiraceae bacterium]